MTADVVAAVPQHPKREGVRNGNERRARRHKIRVCEGKQQHADDDERDRNDPESRKAHAAPFNERPPNNKQEQQARTELMRKLVGNRERDCVAVRKAARQAKRQVEQRHAHDKAHERRARLLVVAK